MKKLSKYYKNALVTGGSTGLGRSFANMLHNEGINVSITSRNIKRIDKNIPFKVLELDLLDQKSLNQFIENIDKNNIFFDLVINNAGAGSFYRFENFELEEMNKQIQLLLISPTRITQAFYKKMIVKKQGTIVNISSLGGTFPIPLLSIYSGAKSGLSAITSSLIVESVESNIKIIDIQPGDYSTNFNDVANKDMSLNKKGFNTIFKYIEKHRYSSPLPIHAANKLRLILLKQKSGQYIIGSFFQSKIGPIISKIVPKKLIFWFLKRYYHTTK